MRIACFPDWRLTIRSSAPHSSARAPRDMSGELATCNYFGVLGIGPAIGRTFAAGDCAGSSPVAVLSDAAWRNIFAADPSIVGKTITLNRVPLTVIGVTPPGFHGAQISAADFWAPLTLEPKIDTHGSLKEDNLSWLVLAGRLKSGIGLDEARPNLGVIARRIDQLHPGRTTTLSVEVATLISTPEERHDVTHRGQGDFCGRESRHRTVQPRRPGNPERHRAPGLRRADTAAGHLQAAQTVAAGARRRGKAVVSKHPLQLRAAYGVCRHIARSAAKNFYYGFLVLPARKRNALVGGVRLHASCRRHL